MLKHINPQNILTTPFIAAKSHVLSNTQNSDAIVLEQDGTTTIALDYVNYNFGIPFLNSDCNIALEQQDADAVAYQEGVLDTDTFNSSSSPRNADGTYKGLVHRTTKNAFYNTYHNPTKIFGVEHIDFALSNTLRNIADQFRMFSLTPLQFGDKIEPKSVRFYDTLFDDNVTVFDDGCQNLIAGFNLFSKVQEVRIWPAGSNPQVILPGTTSYTCPSYAPTAPPTTTFWSQLAFGPSLLTDEFPISCGTIFIPDSASGNVLTADLIWGGSGCNVGYSLCGDLSMNPEHGELTYVSATPINCNLHLSITGLANPGDFGFKSATIRIYNGITSDDLNLDFTSYATGEYDIPFTVQAGSYTESVDLFLGASPSMVVTDEWKVIATLTTI